MMRWLTRTSVLVLLSVAGTPAWAQTPAADEATIPATAAGPPSLRVMVQAAQALLDPYAVQRAIEGELGVIVRGDVHPDVVGTLNVVATGPDTLTMEYVGNDGRRNSRTVKLPAAAAKRLETVALVAGNLARDETGQLIEELRPPPTSPHESPEDSAAAPAAEPAPPAPKLPAPAVAVEPTPETKPNAAAAAAAPALDFRVVNFSLFSPIALYANSPELEIAAELGLAYSDVGRVHGGALTLFVGRVRYGFQGARVAGLVNVTSGASQGVTVSGLAAFQRGDLTGASVAGVATYSEGDLAGGEVAGAVSFRRGNAAGLQLSGAFNAAHDVDGGQVAGAFNWARSTTGVQLSGASNVTRDASGLMLTGGLNLVTQSVTGVQLAPFNVAQFVNGLQFGIVNVARRVEGVQLGLVNVAEEVDGASVGIIPVAGNGYQRAVVWSTPGVASVSAGGKFGIGPIYTLLGVGFEPTDGETEYVPAFGVGAQWESGPIQLSVDGLYQSTQPTTEDDEQQVGDDPPEAEDSGPDYHVTLRPLVAVRVLPWLRVFGGPAFVSGPHDESWNDYIKVRAAFGVEVFR